VTRKNEFGKYESNTVFGHAVEESGFSRVCPGCYEKWSQKLKWLHDTVFIGNVATEVGATALRKHGCGGQMLAEGPLLPRDREVVS